jgi:hypothetical protein
MVLSNFLANIWGLSFIIIALSLLIYQENIKKIFELAENKTNLFICGVLSLILGIAMVLSHNIWVSNWRIVITLLGWLILVRGIVLLFFPKICLNFLKKIKDNQNIPFALVAVVILGCILIYFGFTA